MYKLISITTILLSVCSMNVHSAPYPFTVESEIISSSHILTEPNGDILQDALVFDVDWSSDFSFIFGDIEGFGTVLEAYSGGNHTTTADADTSMAAQTVNWSVGEDQFGIYGIIDWNDTMFDFFVVWDVVTNGSTIDYIATDMDGDGVRGFNFVNGPFQGLNYSLDVTVVTPIPAAVWLFGSGLLGLIGVARRKKT